MKKEKKGNKKTRILDDLVQVDNLFVYIIVILYSPLSSGQLFFFYDFYASLGNEESRVILLIEPIFQPFFPELNSEKHCSCN